MQNLIIMIKYNMQNLIIMITDPGIEIRSMPLIGSHFPRAPAYLKMDIQVTCLEYISLKLAIPKLLGLTIVQYKGVWSFRHNYCLQLYSIIYWTVTLSGTQEIYKSHMTYF